MELQQKTKTDTNGLIPPYGGELKNLIIKDKNLKNDLISKATYEFECSERNACDVELLMVGAFSPLEGFMDENNYKSVIKITEIQAVCFLAYLSYLIQIMKK